MGKKLNLVGQRFGKLTVLADSGRRMSGNVVWICRCDCGNITNVPTRRLRDGITVSCGCNSKHKSINNLAGDISEKLGQVYGTNISRIKSQKVQKNNKSGHRGVCLVHRKGHSDAWIAYIYFQKKQYLLGQFGDVRDAVSARQKAEKKVFGGFLKWYEEGRNNPKR